MYIYNTQDPIGSLPLFIFLKKIKKKKRRDKVAYE